MKRQSKRPTSGGQESPEPGDQSLLAPYMEHDEADLEEEDEDEERGSLSCGLGGKKRRLALEQVRALERSFEVDNKLDPERKGRIARDLALQPRQVAVWFQNRRARWKTKQLERDFNALRARHDALRSDCDALRRDKDALAAEIRELREKLPKPDTAAVKSEAGIEAELRQAATAGAAGVCNNNKDGSSDSDSSVVFNDEASPCPYSGAGAAVFEQQPGGGFMGFGAPAFLDSSGGCSSSSLLPMLETKWPAPYGSYVDAGKSGGGGYGFTEEWLAGTDAIGNDAGAGFFADEHVSSLNFGWCGSGAEGFDLHGYCKK